MINEIEKALAACTQGDWHWKDLTDARNSLMNILEDGNGKEILNFGDSEPYYPTEGSEPSDADAIVIANATKWLRYLLKEIKDRYGDLHIAYMHGQASMKEANGE